MALTTADFRNSQLAGICLRRALLRGARFDESMLEKATFDGPSSSA